MEIFERIKFLRKDCLKITQEDFAEKIKISRANLGSIEVGRINVTDRVVTDICEAFNISRNWLSTGNGSMYSNVEDEVMEQLSRIKTLDELDIKILKAYLLLPLEYRKMFRDYMRGMIETANDTFIKDVKQKEKVTLASRSGDNENLTFNNAQADIASEIRELVKKNVDNDDL